MVRVCVCRHVCCLCVSVCLLFVCFCCVVLLCVFVLFVVLAIVFVCSCCLSLFDASCVIRFVCVVCWFVGRVCLSNSWSAS